MQTIFLSSTFRDMYPERDILLEKTIPALNQVAMKYGDYVSACDLRWGIDTTEMTEDALNQKVLNVCFDEIDRSQPPMIVILGERYGWIPPESSLEEIAAHRQLQLEDLQKSVTALEIEYGAFSHRYHTLFYFREAVGDMPEGYGAEDALHQQKLAELKQRIKNLTNGQITTYTVHYADKEKYRSDMEQFGKTVYQDVYALLHTKWEKNAKKTATEKELETHRLFIEEKASYFQAKRNEFIQAHDALNNGSRLLLLKGTPGAGKSTLFSKLALELENEGWQVIALSCGMSASSSTAQSLMRLLVRCLEAVTHSKPYDFNPSTNFDAVSGNYEKTLTNRFRYLCNLIAKSAQKHVIMLDAIDQLQADEIRNSFRFVPEDLLSEHLRFVITCLSEMNTSRLDGISTLLIVDTLDHAGKREVIDGILRQHHKELSEQVIDTLVEHTGSDTPLSISLMVQRLLIMNEDDFNIINRSGGDMQSINNRQKAIINQAPDSLEAISVMLMQEAGKRFHPTLIEQAITYIGMSRFGLRITDLARLCKNEWNYLDIAHMLSYLRDSFFERADGRIDFIHKSFRDGIQKHAAHNKKALHRDILNMLTTLDNEDSIKRTEILYHSTQCDDEDFFTSYIEVCAYSKGDYEFRRVTAKCIYELCVSNNHWIRTYIEHADPATARDVLPWVFVEWVCPQFLNNSLEQDYKLAVLLSIDTYVKKMNNTDRFHTMPEVLCDLYYELSVCLHFFNITGTNYHIAKPSGDNYILQYFELGKKRFEQDATKKTQLFEVYYITVLCLKNTHKAENCRLALQIANEGIEKGVMEGAPANMAGMYYGSIGELYNVNGEFEKGYEAYQRDFEFRKVAADKDPTEKNMLDFAGAYQNIGTCLATALRFEEALPYLQTAAEMLDTYFVEEDDKQSYFFMKSQIDCLENLANCYTSRFMNHLEQTECLAHAFDCKAKALVKKRRYDYLYLDTSRCESQYNDLINTLELIKKHCPEQLKEHENKTIELFRSFAQFDITQYRLNKSQKNEWTLRENLLQIIHATKKLNNGTLYQEYSKMYYDEIICVYTHNIQTDTQADQFKIFYYYFNKIAFLIDLNDSAYFEEALRDAKEALLLAIKIYAEEYPDEDMAVWIIQMLLKLAICHNLLRHYQKAYLYAHQAIKMYCLLQDSPHKKKCAKTLETYYYLGFDYYNDLNHHSQKDAADELLLEIINYGDMKEFSQDTKSIHNFHRLLMQYVLSQTLRYLHSPFITAIAISHLPLLEKDIERIQQFEDYIVQNFKQTKKTLDFYSKYRRTDSPHVRINEGSYAVDLCVDLLESHEELARIFTLKKEYARAIAVSERALKYCKALHEIGEQEQYSKFKKKFTDRIEYVHYKKEKANLSVADLPDLPDGEHTYRYEDGSVYTGNWKNRQKSGFGKMLYADGSSYEGVWQNDKRNGYGIFIGKDGRSRYEGDWKNDCHDGFGKAAFSAGGYYEGEWKNGEYCGYGIKQPADGERICGVWNHSRLVKKCSRFKINKVFKNLR